MKPLAASLWVALVCLPICWHQGALPARGDETRAGNDSTPSFRHDVVPVLTRFGCNMGACHGKQAGQNGFRLSLRGYAPAADHESITREFQGRRIARTVPRESLLLVKPAGATAHGGGRLFAVDSPAYEVLLKWIEDGAPGLLAEEKELTGLTITSGELLMTPGETRQLAVQASFNDDSTREVTWLAQFFSNDESVLEVTPEGLVTAMRAGETSIRVHFEHLVSVVTFTIPHAETVAADKFVASPSTIDQHVLAKLQALRIEPSPLCEDLAFLRRVYLDTIGTLPTAAEVDAFTADKNPGKRARVVDELLQRPEWVDYWTLELGKLLQNRKERDHDVRGVKGVRSLHAWLRQQVAQNRGWHEIARDVLTSSGNNVENPAIGYFIVTVGEKREPEKSEVVASVAQSFLGTRIGCAQCHNHPLEKYTQDDYYHFAAFFARVSFDRHKPEEGPTSLIVCSAEKSNLLRRREQLQKKVQELETESKLDEKQQEQLDRQREQLAKTEEEIQNFQEKPARVRQPRTGQMLPPRALDRTELALPDDVDPRHALVDWMLGDGHEYFAGSMVNRLWKHFLAKGLVEPVDDLRASNPPSNQPLWDYLVQEFESHNYDLKHVMRLILNSRTYQASSSTLPGNVTDQRFYSHYYARRLQAEVLKDALSQCTGVPDEFPGYPCGVRAIQVPDPSVASYFLSLFGRSDRVTACACEENSDVTLPQLLHMQNGDWIGSKLDAPEGRLQQLIKAAQAESSDGKISEAVAMQISAQLFKISLCRAMNEEETKIIARLCRENDDRGYVLRDVFWAIFNTKEFIFNH